MNAKTYFNTSQTVKVLENKDYLRNGYSYKRNLGDLLLPRMQSRQGSLPFLDKNKDSNG